MHVALEWTAATETGRHWKRNEDAYAVIPEAQLFVLADGMSGQPAGHLASRMAVGTVQACYDYLPEFSCDEARRGSPLRAIRRLRTAYRLANQLVYERNCRVAPLRPMGASLLGVQFLHRYVVVAHVGDSRCYRFRHGELTQLTRDHILLEENRRYLTGREIEDLRPLQQHVLSRAIGRDGDVKVDIRIGAWRPNDLYLLCSNGLFEALSPRAIGELLASIDDLDEACQSLVATAYAIDGHDDITAILARLQPTRRLRWTVSSPDEMSEKPQPER